MFASWSSKDRNSILLFVFALSPKILPYQLATSFNSSEASMILILVGPSRGISHLFEYPLMHGLFLLHSSNRLDMLHFCIDFYLKFRKIFIVIKNKQNTMLMELAGKELCMLSHISYRHSTRWKISVGKQ